MSASLFGPCYTRVLSLSRIATEQTLMFTEWLTRTVDRPRRALIEDDADESVSVSRSYRPSRVLVDDPPSKPTIPDRPARPLRALPVAEEIDDDVADVTRGERSLGSVPEVVPAPDPNPKSDTEADTEATLVPGLLAQPAAPTLDRVALVAARPVVKPHSRHLIDPIVIDGLIKSYNGSVAVRNLSFTVEPGRVTGFLGPNGAGKTTTLRILVGLVAATAGDATFGDTP